MAAAWRGVAVAVVVGLCVIHSAQAVQNFAFTSDSPVAAAGDTTGTASGAAHGVALGADVTAARPPAMHPSARAAPPSAPSERRTLFVTRQSARALAHQVAAVRRGAEGGVDMRDIPMQQVELQPCDPATQDCKELEWVFRIEKPDFSTPAAPRRVLEEEAGSDVGQGEPASDGSGAGSGDGDGAGGAGMVESVMSWLGGSGGADDATPQEPAASPDARPPLVPPVADDEFGAELGKSLFVWLGLPHDAFFVNLKPNEPERVLHPQISATVVGRVLLEADFFLKNVTSFLLHPDTESGHIFWESVYEPPPAATCVSFRQWIVPLQSTVVESDEHVYVVEAPLDVKEEAEYVSWSGEAGAASMNACNAEEQNPEILAIGNAVFRQQILPRVAASVNNAEVFKELRYIFYWRVLAEWFDRMHPEHFADVQPQDYQAWSQEAGMAYAKQVWDIYANSNLNGLYTAKKLIRHEGNLFRRTYSHGEMDLASVPLVAGRLRTQS